MSLTALGKEIKRQLDPVDYEDVDHEDDYTEIEGCWYLNEEVDNITDGFDIAETNRSFNSREKTALKERIVL